VRIAAFTFGLAKGPVCYNVYPGLRTFSRYAFHEVTPVEAHDVWPRPRARDTLGDSYEWKTMTHARNVAEERCGPVQGQKRDAGVLMHVTSLPGPHGIGDLGAAAYAWIDALRRARQTWWQVLPLGPPGEGSSPYNATSAFAGNSSLISPEATLRDGLINRTDLPTTTFPAGRVDYGPVTRSKAQVLSRAWERFRAGAAQKLRDCFDQFREANGAWLDDYTLFTALKEATGNKPWAGWPRDLVLRKPAALREARRELEDAIARHRFAQFLFHRQWGQLRRYAHDHGIRVMGDLPIFVSAESADVWARPELFRLDRYRRPTVVAGVPPDYFSATGQRWGNPLYDWKAMRREGYQWWIARFRSTLAMVDAVRIDHFRGFEACWEIPARAPTAATGRWVKTPGADLFRMLCSAMGRLPFVAEDLGLITPDVSALRDELGLPGMRVLQFAFGGGADSPHLPHNHVRECVAYTGTHDNDTCAGWFRTLSAKGRRHLREYLPSGDADVAWAMLWLTWSSVADRAIAPIQDVLGLGSDARMNTPGRSTGNWRWRLADRQLTCEHLDRLGELTAVFGRDVPIGSKR
jgi:4-alpha-glucanotransferase